MEYYNTYLDLGCFTLQEICRFFPTKKTAQNRLTQSIKKGLIERVKQNFYVTIDIVRHEPLLSKFVIASKMDSHNYIAYHSALEYYGYHNQVMNEVIYCGEKKCRDFFFQNVNYHFVCSKCPLQIETVADGAKITTLERTVIDCIDNLYLAGSIEELYRALDVMPSLDESRLLEILDYYNKKSLYQRVGYILSNFQEQLNISDEFLLYLHSKIDHSICYLIPSKKMLDTKFNQNWNICVPTYINQILTKGGLNIVI